MSNVKLRTFIHYLTVTANLRNQLQRVNFAAGLLAIVPINYNGKHSHFIGILENIMNYNFRLSQIIFLKTNKAGI